MNTPTSDRPRFVCRLLRLWAALTDRTPDRHAVTCDDCRQYFAAGTDLDQQLRRSARLETAPVPEGLEDRIFTAIAPTLAQRRRASRPTWWIGVCVGGAAAAAIAVGVILTQQQPAKSPAPQVAQANASTSTDPLVAIETYSEQLQERVAPVAATLKRDPLQEELNAVQSDAQSALRFLAMNFLPASTTATLLPSSSAPTPST
jgi:hypothetical protein